MRPIYSMLNDRFPRDSIEALRTQLFLSSGTYCSFCEIPLGGEMEVADRVCAGADVVTIIPPGQTPFKWYLGQPWAGLSFRNALLSCRSCRALRGSYPSNYEALEVLAADDPAMYQQVLASMRAGARALPPDQTEALYAAAARSMLWPDTSLSTQGEVLFQGTSSERSFTYEYSSSSQVQLAQRGLVRLSAEDAAQGWANTPYTGLWVVPNPGIVDLRERDRAYATVQMSFLNSFHPYRWPTDNRVQARTRALEAIQASWQRLNWILGSALTFYQNVPNALELLLGAPSVIDAAQFVRTEIWSTGFWSVWFSVFGENMRTVEPWSRLTDGQRELVLFSLFIQYEPRPLRKHANEPRELVNVLPGTDLYRIPLFQKEPRR